MNIIKKTVAVAMIAGAALAVSACGKTENTNVTENTTVTDMNTTAPEEGTMNDMSGMEMGNESNSSNMM
jgi:ABC-type Fe3+-citrate transport system substrate-binding protein